MDENEQRESYYSVLGKIKQNNRDKLANVQPVAFIAGPYIEVEKVPNAKSSNTAKILRYELINQLRDDGWIITLGEYQELINDSKQIFGKSHNTLLAELSHVIDDNVHAVIMLPSSPGSFLELGTFCRIEEICKKMLIVVDKKYKPESKKSYLKSGPLEEAKGNYAEVEYISYSNIKECTKVVSAFIIDKWQKTAKKEAFGDG